MNTENKIQNKFLLAIFVVCCLLIMYSPILGHTFAYHNDYRIWEYNAHDHWLGYPETMHLFGIGRPILGVLLNVHLMLINSMTALQVAHLISILSIVLLAAFYFLYLEKNLKINQVSAVILSIFTFLLPSIAVNAFWVADYTSEIIPLFIVLLAYALVQKETRGKLRAYRFVTAGILLYLDLLIYPPATCFFLTLSFVTGLFGVKQPNEAAWSDLFRQVVLFLGVCLLYFITIKLIWKPFLIHYAHFSAFDYWKNQMGVADWRSYYKHIADNAPEYNFAIGFNYLEKMSQVKNYLIFVFSAWFPLLPWCWVLIILFPFFAILSWSAYSGPYLKNVRFSVRIPVLVATLVGIALLTALPILIGPSQYQVNYRVTFASMAIIPAVIVFAMDRLLSKPKNTVKANYFMLIFFALFLMSAQAVTLHRLILAVERASDEYAHIRIPLERYISSKTKEIYIQTPVIDVPDSKFLIADFGLNATDIHMAGIVKAALTDIGLDPNRYVVTFGSDFYPDTTGTALLISRTIIQANKISEKSIVGEWQSNGKVASISFNEGAFTLTNEVGMHSRGKVIENGEELVASDWNNVKAILTPDHKRLIWDNGSTWLR